MSAFHWIVIALAVGVLVKFIQWIREQQHPKIYICTACEFQGPGTLHTRGSFLIEALLWLAFLVPGLIYSLWRLSTRQKTCQKCQATHLIPVDSPRGRELVRRNQ